MTRKRKLFVGSAAGLVLLAIGLVVYLALSDLSGWRDTFARTASNAMKRELTIGGDFAVDVGLVTRIHATDVSLANAAWGSDPEMATSDRLDIEIALLPLLRGSIHLPSIDIEGGRALFESNATDGSNWLLVPPGDSPIRLRIDRVRAHDVELVFWPGEDRPDVDLLVEAFDSSGSRTGHQELSGNGTVNGTRWALAGQLGPLNGLVNLTKIDHDLELRLGSAVLHSAGSVADLRAISGLDIEATLDLPNPSEIAAVFGLPPSNLQALTATATASSSGASTDMAIGVAGASAELDLHGTVDSVVAPHDLDIDIRLSGPDIRPVAALAGLGTLDAAPFKLVGNLRWRGFPIEITGLEATVGDSSVSADGRLGAPPLMLDTDFTFSGSGPDAGAVASLAGLRLPHQAFELDGRLLRVENGLRVERLLAVIGRNRMTAVGYVGDPPEYARTDLAVTADGPDLDVLAAVVGRRLPSEPFEVEGRLADGGDAIALDSVRVSVGDTTLTVDGRVTTVAGMVGTDLTGVIDIPDMSMIEPVTGLSGLPEIPVHVRGGVVVEPGTYRLDGIRGRFGDDTFALDGQISNQPQLTGSTLRFEVNVADPSVYEPVVEDRDLPAEPFHGVGTLEWLETGYGVREIDLELGSARATIDGVVGPSSTFVGTDVSITAAGPSLAVADDLFPGHPLPPVDFDVRATIAVDDSGVRVTNGAAVVDGNRLGLDGTVTYDQPLRSSTINLTAAGPDLGSAARLLSTILDHELPELPALEYTASGTVAPQSGAQRSVTLDATLGEARAKIAGDIGNRPRMVGTELSVNLSGPDVSILRSVTGSDLPAAPFDARGRLRIDDDGTGLDDVRIRFGDFHGEINGTIGPRPTLIGTDLTVSFDGPNLAVVGDTVGVAGLPSLPFHLEGDFEGTPQRFTSDRFRARIGSSDLGGDLRVQLEGKPSASVALRSARMDLPELRLSGKKPTEKTEKQAPANAPTEDRVVFSDTAIDLAVLDRFDLELDWQLDELVLLFGRYRDVEMRANLADGRLQVDRYKGTGEHGGSLHGTASLVPDPLGYRVDAQVELDDGLLNLAGEDVEEADYAPIDTTFRLSSVGRSPHELASTADGEIAIVLEGGVLAKSILDRLTSDIVVTLLGTLNPFSTDDKQAHLHCAVIYALIDEGIVELDPIAIQTDRMTIVGGGTIDLSTESVKLDWVTKPRRGFGLSASMVTNSYFRLGGTLGDPHVEVKPLEAMATTGVAVATAGLSILGKGLFDRITAEKKVCQKALEKVEKVKAGRPD